MTAPSSSHERQRHAPARPDLAALSAAERRALLLLDSPVPFARRTGGWRGGLNRIGLDTANSLIARGLARRSWVNGRSTLQLGALGLRAAAELRARRADREKRP